MPSHWSTVESVLRGFNITNYIRIRNSSDTETMMFDCNNGGFQTRFQIRINDGLKRLTIISQPTWNMPENRRSATLLYVTLLNYRLVVGSVDIDLSDGEVRFKTAAPFGNAANIRPIVETFMRVHVNEAKKYLEGFAAIRDRNADAEDAMRVAGMSGPGGGGAGGASDDAAARLLLQLLLSQAGRR